MSVPKDEKQANRDAILAFYVRYGAEDMGLVSMKEAGFQDLEKHAKVPVMAVKMELDLTKLPAAKL